MSPDEKADEGGEGETSRETTPGHDRRESGSESDEKESGKGGLKQIGYWGGRVGQILLVGFAGLLLLGSLLGNMNVLAFAVISIFALVLFALVGVVELLIIRPLS